jgi:hypothetical protein
LGWRTAAGLNKSQRAGDDQYPGLPQAALHYKYAGLKHKVVIGSWAQKLEFFLWCVIAASVYLNENLNC